MTVPPLLHILQNGISNGTGASVGEAMDGCGVGGGDVGPAVAACVVGGDTVGDIVLPRRFPSEGAFDGTMEGVSDGIAVTETSVGEFVVGVVPLPTMSTMTGDNVGDAVGGVGVSPTTSAAGSLVPPVQQTGANSFRTL